MQQKKKKKEGKEFPVYADIEPQTDVQPTDDNYPDGVVYTEVRPTERPKPRRVNITGLDGEYANC